MSKHFSAKETFAICGDSDDGYGCTGQLFYRGKDLSHHARCRRLPEGVGPDLAKNVIAYPSFRTRCIFRT